jgi:glycosyltransferase involved in cell wall biosynthesis
MRVAIDALGIDQPGGGRTAILNLLRSLFAMDRENRYLVFLSAYEESLGDFGQVEQRIMNVRNRFLVRIWMQAFLPVFLRKEKVDLVHYTKNLGAFLTPCKTIITIHDLTTLILKETHSAIDVLYWRIVEPFMIQQADEIIAVSHETKWDIIKMYQVPENKITVIHWAPSESFRILDDVALINKVRVKYGLPVEFILFVGILAKKKNLSTLIRSFALLKRDSRLPHKLVIVGRKYQQSSDRHVLSLVRELDLENEVIFTGLVPDADLPALYNASDLFVIPSLHEGFGIVCLEAMACGVPVVASRTGALPEVVGEAGILVEDPTDKEQLAQAIGQVLWDTDLRKELIAKGSERARMFSWDKAARQTMWVYQKALES